MVLIPTKGILTLSDTTRLFVMTSRQMSPHLGGIYRNAVTRSVSGLVRPAIEKVVTETPI